MKRASSTIHQQSKLAYMFHLKGRFKEAIAMQTKIVHALRGAKSTSELDAMKRLALYLFMVGNFSRCAEVLAEAAQIDEQDPEVTGNLGIALSRCQRHQQAIPWLEKARAADPKNENWLDGLAHCYGRLGDRDAARRSGERSLQLKAEAAEATASDIVPSFPALSAFDPSRSDENIIAFSLWGDNPRYLEGALRNARLVPDLYPGWTCRFYFDDSVPKAALNMLQRYGAQTIPRPRRKRFYDGLLWRFDVVDKPAIRRFLIRDADSLVGAREKAAVDAWLSSGRHFHAMRDFYTHTELILAGMWGGVGGILPSVNEMVSALRSKRAPTHTYDQWMLRVAVWPRIRSSLLVHDSWFHLPDSRRFPENAWGAPDTHVGQNFSVTRRAKAEPPMWDPEAQRS